ncbi:hypothetical protein [Pseudomonas sp. dw_358]|uniref:hypothetical protein n=1 Tax=Pseudomonas sp. dw_358 TaxID=2720083 RepID=UPI001BD1D204|nr:hypothetical protein [Pseudomonas sp. dw_358]
MAVISVTRLSDPASRKKFTEGVFERSLDTSDVPIRYSGAILDSDEPKPDFNDNAFDLLRSCFSYDLAQARTLIQKTRFGDTLLDNDDLNRYLVKT